MRIARVAAVAMAAGLALGGCASSQPPPPAPSISYQLPGDGVLANHVGIENAPDGFSLPRGLVISDLVDQPNVITFITDKENASVLESYLIGNLDKMGFSITGQAPGSLVFEREGWQGAFTTSDEIAGFALRKNPGVVHSPQAG